MHEKTAGTKKAPALDYGATAPGQNGFLHPVTGLTVTGRTVARVRGEGKVWRWLLSAKSARAATSISWSVPNCSLVAIAPAAEPYPCSRRCDGAKLSFVREKLNDIKQKFVHALSEN